MDFWSLSLWTGDQDVCITGLTSSLLRPHLLSYKSVLVVGCPSPNGSTVHAQPTRHSTCSGWVVFAWRAEDVPVEPCNRS